MRTDPTKEKDFVQSSDWIGKLLDLNFVEAQPGTPARMNSLSGGERNRLFLARYGYEDASLVSGIDCAEDGRGYALWDFNQDGFQDIALISPQAPRVQIFRNDIAKVLQTKAARITIRLVGGNDKPTASSIWSNRDGVGARVVVTDAKGKQRTFLRSIGEGFSSQNSAAIWIGLGEQEYAHRITVFWPSGKQQVFNQIAAGSTITARESDAE